MAWWRPAALIYPLSCPGLAACAATASSAAYLTFMFPTSGVVAFGSRPNSSLRDFNTALSELEVLSSPLNQPGLAIFA